VQADSIPIKYTDPTQETESLQKVASDIAAILTSSEEILYIALQNRSAGPLKKDSAVATSQRIILYRPKMMGKFDFTDHSWHDVTDVSLKQGMMSSDLTVKLVSGRADNVGGLNKDQAKRLYGICQELEHEYRETRRQRDLEEARAKSGGFNFASGVPGAQQSAAQPTQPVVSAPLADDPVQRLAKAKSMLDQQLISQDEYDGLKARILAEM